MLKSAIYQLLEGSPDGLTNSEIGKQLGIYKGYAGTNKQQGHISRTVLEYMREEFTVVQVDVNEKKLWRLSKVIAF